MKTRPLKIFAVVLVVVVGLYCLNLAVPRHDYFLERAGVLDKVEHSEWATPASIMESVRLENSTGLVVEMRVVRPANTGDNALPFVLMLGGHRTGKDAVDLVGVSNHVAYAAIDYPYAGREEIDGLWQSITTVPDIQRAFIDAPAALSLALTWALQQPWVDKTRVELVGVSLGVPFAAAAGAVDTRFTRVWLLHGGGDNLSWVDHAGRKRIESDTLRRIAARTALFLVYGNSFDTKKWIAKIAPRPLIIVAACNDDYVPPEAQLPLVEASKSDTVELIWTTGQHIGPRRGDELQQLLKIVDGRVGLYLRTGSVDCVVD
ncbi:MAG: alpha/beta hydrolase [Gammaproteobacteria bacterium]|nr:alpha/beta hydrolase [Gammaproteobacteria bacterium]NND54958.1 alpha/beta hydrolase [Gammaproteobacteria bacterium]